MYIESEQIKQRLHDVIAELIGEERDFEQRCKEAEIDDGHLAKEHAYAVNRLGEIGDHAKIRSAHVAMFKVHRKIRQHHRTLIKHALSISSRLEGDHLSEREIKWELRRVQEALVRTKLEHQVIEQERRKILQDHQSIVKRLKNMH